MSSKNVSKKRLREIDNEILVNGMDAIFSLSHALTVIIARDNDTADADLEQVDEDLEQAQADIAGCRVPLSMVIGARRPK